MHRTVPAWALQHLRDNEAAIGQVLNVRRHSRGVVLANTRHGAVVVSRRPFGAVAHQFLGSPREHIRVACPTCSQGLEFRSLAVPATVHCGRCGRKIHLDRHGSAAPAPAPVPTATPTQPAGTATDAAWAQQILAAGTASGAKLGDVEQAIRVVGRKASDRLGSLVPPAQRPPQAGPPRLDGDASLQALKTTFVNAAAHELQTPMTPLLLSLHTLEQEAGADKQGSVRLAVRNAKRLEEVIGNVVRVARIQASGLPVQPVATDARDIWLDAAAAWRPRFEAAGVRLQARFLRPLRLQGDPDRLRELADHLLSNALRFTPAGGRTVVSGRAAEGGIVLTVADSGPGIVEADRDRAVQPFVQLENARMQTQGGLGLGLFFARAIAEAHEGTLKLASARQEGLADEVHLPRAPRVTDRPATTPRSLTANALPHTLSDPASNLRSHDA